MAASKTIRRFNGPKPTVQPYSYLGCPETVSRGPWCYRTCRPINGMGTCGRVAPHALKSRVQRAIARSRAEDPVDPDMPRFTVGD
jgi:hypothetical protein